MKYSLILVYIAYNVKGLKISKYLPTNIIVFRNERHSPLKIDFMILFDRLKSKFFLNLSYKLKGMFWNHTAISKK
jgi:hypothetical protein